jgi:energy-coupling factor transport system permease protein
MNRPVNARAWIIWVIAAALIVFTTRNPLYLAIILLAARVVEAVGKRPGAGLTLVFWRLALAVLFFSMLFNMLLVHVGQTVLFTLPSNWWLVGGPVTLEAAVYGAINGLILLALLSIFLTFNAVVPVSELVRLAPQALANVGLIVLIAVSYVPETMRHLERIREAQSLRGRDLSGLRDWQPLLIPLLIGGLERSMNLAETMVARGYGASADVRLSVAPQAGLMAGLLLSFAGWLLTFWVDWAGWLVLALGVASMLLVYWRMGRGMPRTRYMKRPWRTRDSIIVAGSVAALLFFLLPLPFVDYATLNYSPYPTLTMPPFDPILGLAAAALVLPALVLEA